MSDSPINLNRFRKAKARAEKRSKADRNAALHGLSKAEKAASAQEETRRRAQLENTRLQKESDAPGSGDGAVRILGNNEDQGGDET